MAEFADLISQIRKETGQPVSFDADIFPTIQIDDSRKIAREQANEKKAEFYERCARDRVFFVRAALGAEPEPWQEKVLRDLDGGATKVAIRSGNGVGKTTLCAWLADHYVLFRSDVKIPITAPSSSQLKDGLYPECVKWIRKMPLFLQEQLSVTSDRIVRVDNPENSFVSFRTARKETPEALAGIHAKFVMAIVDEASGVPDEVFESAQGTLSTPGAIIVLIGNPTRLSGYFFDAFHKMSRAWTKYHVTSFDTSRVDHAFVNLIRDAYGEDHDQYRIRVLGEFPKHEQDTLISRELALACIGRDIEYNSAVLSVPPIWGVDCGRGGDDSSLLIRHGMFVPYIDMWSYADTMATTGRVKAKWDETPERYRPASIHVDSIGIGAGVADRLRELGLPALDVNVAESPAAKNLYMRMRDELWFAAKEWVDGMTGVIVTETVKEEFAELLAVELSSPLVMVTSSGKNQVESKMQMRARGIKSPNIADALCLTFAHQGGVMAGRGMGAKSSWGKPLKFVPAHVH